MQNACSHISLYAVQWAYMKFHELACSFLSLHAVPFFVWAAHKNFAVLVRWCSIYIYFFQQSVPNRRQIGYVEQVGTYDMMTNSNNEKLISLNLERIQTYIAGGVHVSIKFDQVHELREWCFFKWLFSKTLIRTQKKS